MVAPKFRLNRGEILYLTDGDTYTPNKLPFPELKPKVEPISIPKLTFLSNCAGINPGLVIKGLIKAESLMADVGKVSDEICPCSDNANSKLIETKKSSACFIVFDFKHAK